MDTVTLEARIENPAFAVPGAMEALGALSKAVQRGGIPPRTTELMHLRASQINGCGVCAVHHPRIARSLGERTTPIASSVSGQRSRIQSRTGVPRSRRIASAGSAAVIGEVWKTKIASNSCSRNRQGPSTTAAQAKLT